MTHEELDKLGPVLQERCNAVIAERWPSWSRYATDQMISDTMHEIAPNWAWMTVSVLNGIPRVALTQYDGDVE